MTVRARVTPVGRIVRTAAATLVVAGGLVACGSSGSGGSTTSAPTTKPAPTPARTRAASPTPTPSSSTPTPATTVTTTVTSSPTPATPAATAQDLTVTAKVRLALVKAGAASHDLPASDFTGLAPGETYYALDPASSTYWAGAGLVPSDTSEPAQVSVQDDGSYLLFMRPVGGSWTATNVGLAGIAGSTCPEKVPAAVLAVWHWKAHTCRPPA